jgi:hypothetical protein
MRESAKRLSVFCLTAGLAGLFIIRVLISGDGAGAIVVIGLFWLVALGLLLKLVVALSDGEGGWEYLFLLLALLAFGASAIFGKDAVGHATFIVFAVSLAGLAIAWFGRWRRGSLRQ